MESFGEQFVERLDQMGMSELENTGSWISSLEELVGDVGSTFKSGDAHAYLENISAGRIKAISELESGGFAFQDQGNQAIKRANTKEMVDQMKTIYERVNKGVPKDLLLSSQTKVDDWVEAFGEDLNPDESGVYDDPVIPTSLDRGVLKRTLQNNSVGGSITNSDLVGAWKDYLTETLQTEERVSFSKFSYESKMFTDFEFISSRPVIEPVIEPQIVVPKIAEISEDLPVLIRRKVGLDLPSIETVEEISEKKNVWNRFKKWVKPRGVERYTELELGEIPAKSSANLEKIIPKDLPSEAELGQIKSAYKGQPFDSIEDAAAFGARQPQNIQESAESWWKKLLPNTKKKILIALGGTVTVGGVTWLFMNTVNASTESPILTEPVIVEDIDIEDLNWGWIDKPIVTETPPVEVETTKTEETTVTDEGVDISEIYKWRTLITYAKDNPIVGSESLVFTNKKNNVSVVFDMTNKIMICILPNSVRRGLSEEESQQIDKLSNPPLDDGTSSYSFGRIVRTALSSYITYRAGWYVGASIYNRQDIIGNIFNFAWSSFYAILTIYQMDTDGYGVFMEGTEDYLRQEPNLDEWIRYNWNTLLPTVLRDNITKNIQVSTINKYIIPATFISVLYTYIEVKMYHSENSLARDVIVNTVVGVENVLQTFYDWVYNWGVMQDVETVTQRLTHEVGTTIKEDIIKPAGQGLLLGIVAFAVIQGFRK